MNSSIANVIIPCCGNGSRFGMATPKHLIEINGKPMVAWVIEHLPPLCGVRVLVRGEYLAMTQGMLGRYRNVEVLPVMHYQKGACETVMAAHIANNKKVLVINCDNVIQPTGGWHTFLSAYDNAIITFVDRHKNVEPPPFSYVRVDHGHVIEVAEKRRLSQNACAGAFLFRDFDTLTMLCKWHLNLDPPDVRTEWYLAPVYSRLIDDPKSPVRSVPLKLTSVFIRMGTPSEANEARKELYRVYGNQR